jgi:hypothetical protein
MLKTYHGSCHCGAIRFEADLDLAQGTGRCNCSFCTKARWWGISVKPDAFRLLSGEEQLCDYQFNTGSAHHLFCGVCGVRPFGRGDIEQIGGKYVGINLACLDDVPPAELIAAPLRFMNGRDNDWWHAPIEVRHL